MIYSDSQADCDDSIQHNFFLVGAQKRLHSRFQIILGYAVNDSTKNLSEQSQTEAQIQLVRFIHIYSIHSSDSFAKYIRSKVKELP